MKLASLRRRSLAALTGALMAVVLVPAQPAAAAPAITSSVAPQSGPTTGGTPIRIYGTGFGTTNTGVDVEFDNVNATDFQVIDDTLITAVVPAASGGSGANNTFVDVEVTTAGGTTTAVDGFYYTNATFTVSPSTGLDDGEAITTTLDGYTPNTGLVVPQFNPLLVYVENFPEFTSYPPYAEVLAGNSTDGTGDLTVNTSLANPFVGDPTYDANIDCPVNQTTANFLGTSDSASLSRPAYSGRCMVANGALGVGTVERAIKMTNDPSPAAETLAISPTSDIDRLDTVTVSGSNWNANPFFGSSKLAGNPGETTVTVQICNSVGSTCSATEGTATVAPTRYIYNTNTGVFDFSGATLSGTIVVGNDVPSPCTTCFVRVKQNRPASGNIQETLAIPID